MSTRPLASTISVALVAGATTVATVLVVAMVAVATLVAATGVCVPSIIYTLAFGSERGTTHVVLGR